MIGIIVVIGHDTSSPSALQKKKHVVPFLFLPNIIRTDLEPGS
jgi:hypothetical protein